MTQLLYDQDWMLDKVGSLCGRDLASAIRALPPHMHQSVLEYLVHGSSVGDFLTAVFRNDFKETVARADDINSLALRQWANLLHNVPISPLLAYGSQKDMETWQATGGLLGLLKPKGNKGE